MTAKRSLDEVEIPKGVQEQLEQVEDTHIGPPRAKWQDWEDKVLLDYWHKKPKREVARTLGKSEEVCRRRYRYLTGGSNGTNG
jgi:hypothetical protein